jgi:hypothetical protein
MEDRLSRVSLDGFLTAGWSGGLGEAAPCVLSFEDFLGGLPLLAAPPGADLGWDGPALGDDLLGLLRGERAAVGVADEVGLAAAHDGPGSFGEGGGDDAGGAEVVFAAFGHLLVVEAGELGVLLAGGVRGADQVFADAQNVHEGTFTVAMPNRAFRAGAGSAVVMLAA